MSDNKHYGADSIQVLEGLEAVRKRPAMYIGDVGQRGLHHLVYEVVDNSIDEALAGHATRIEVTIHESNSITVKDDGRGIPVAMHTKEGRSALEVVMTVLHAGGKFDKDSYKVSGGLHGVGVSCVNALSSLLKVNVHRDGKEYQQEYNIGKPLYDVKEVGPSSFRGTIVYFEPDTSIFYESVYQFDILAARLRELSYLNRGIRILLTDERDIQDDGTQRSQEFFSVGGLKEFTEFIDQNREKLIPEPMYMEGEIEGIPVEVSMIYNTSYAEIIHSYVNNINTHEGGTHLAGFRRALTRSCWRRFSRGIDRRY
jgi:DNA gyrase subunit B